MNKKKDFMLKNISVAIALALSVCVYAVEDFQSGCENVRDSVLRLHVIANSDSDADQQLKLRVRDAIIETGALIFNECDSKEEAAEIAKEQSAYLTETAERVIRESGREYGVSVEIGKEIYPVRTYENATLPAGEYLSLRVVIGEGAGRNWWCVVFPPMCVSAATEEQSLETVLNGEGMMVVNSDPKYEVRFKLVEWWERIFNER